MIQKISIPYNKKSKVFQITLKRKENIFDSLIIQYV